MPTLRIPLVGSITNRKPNAAVADTQDQRWVNCFPDLTKNPITGKPDVTLNKRQGCTAGNDVVANATGSYGAVVWTTNSAAVAPAIFSYSPTSTSTAFFNSAGSQIGANVSSTNACLSMEETDLNASTGHLTAMLTDNVTGVVKAFFFPEGGAWTQVTSAPIATSTLPICPAHAHMDGFQFVMREDAKIFHPAVNTVSSWPALNFVTANSFADNGVGCARYRNLIVGFGDLSCEFFYNAGNAVGSVLARIENATLRVGAIRNTIGRGTAIRSIGNNVYWIGVNADTGAKGIYRFNGMQAEKVSANAVDKMIANGAIRSIVGSFNLLGMSHVAFGAGTTTVVCFCIDTGYWWFLTPGGSLNIAAILSASDSSAIAKSYFATTGNAKVYSIDPSTPLWQDNTSTYTMTAQTGVIDVNTNKKKVWESLALDYDRQASTSPILISASDDDGATFSAVGTIDAVSSNAQSWISRLGTSRRRQWRVENSSNTATRIKTMEINYKQGIA